MVSRHLPAPVGPLLAAVLLLAAAAPLNACADGTRTAAGAASRSAWTLAPQKGHIAGVNVSYRIDGVPTPGEPVGVSLSFSGVDPAGGATVTFTADAGLSLESGATGPLVLTPGQSTAAAVKVVPNAEGLFYLNVFTTQRGATSATSIPVRVGKSAPAMRTTGELKSLPDGERTIAMPVK